MAGTVVRMGLVLALAACASSSAARPETPANTMTSSPGSEVPAWLLPDDACPAEVVAVEEVDVNGDVGWCTGPDDCLPRCEAHDAVACYAAAQQLRLDRPMTSEALFLRACRLGVASGCTNRAAGMMIADADDPRVATCTTRTFEMTCARKDPWGCVMLSQALAAGRGVARDLDRAEAVLRDGCRYGPDDPACQAAQEMQQRIRDAPR